MSDKIPVLFDTDIGSDIDDAVALAYLLKQPRCELVGVTTVTGDVAQRSALVEIVCRAVGRDDVPIHSGASVPLLTGPGQPNVPHYAAVKNLPHQIDRKTNTAIDFMRQTIRSRPGEITLLSTAPFTNLALLFALDPEIPSLLKQWISMSGVFFQPEPPSEWNCLIDPISTAMAYRAHPRRHVSIGLDVTMKCQLPPETVRQRFTPSPLDVVAKMAEVWFAQSKMMTFHDPLAAAVIFKPELCRYVQGTVAILQDEDPNRGGATKFVAGPPTAPHTVAQDVDALAFFEEYFGVF